MYSVLLRQQCNTQVSVFLLIEDQVSKTAAVDQSSGTKKRTPKKSRPKGTSIDLDSSATAKARTDSFTAEVFVAGLPHGGSPTPAEKNEIVVTNAQGVKETREIRCLFCDQEME